MNYHCPKCGRETVYRKELEGLCEECFRKKYTLVNLAKINIITKMCPICGRIRFGNKWVKNNPINLKRFILSQLKKLKNIRGYETRFEISKDMINNIADSILSSSPIVIPIKLYKENIEIQDAYVELKIQKQVCPLCHKKTSGTYYEYIIHIRFRGKAAREKEVRIQKIIKQILSRAPGDVFIDIKKIRRGMDIRVSDRSYGEKLLNKITSNFNTEARQYAERKYESNLNKNIIVKKAMIEI